MNVQDIAKALTVEHSNEIAESLRGKNHYERMKIHLPWDKLLPIYKRMGDKTVSFEEFALHPDMSFIEELPVEMSQQVILANIIYHCYLMLRNGEKVYQVTPDLGLMLMNTELHGIKGDAVRMPFDEIMIEVPPNLIKTHHPVTGYHQLECIYLNNDIEKDNLLALRLMFIGSPNEKSCNEFDDSVNYLRFVLDRNLDIREQVKDQIEAWKKDPVAIKGFGNYNFDISHKIFNFILNVLLYVTSSEADLKWMGWPDVDPKIKKVKPKQRKEYIKKLRRNNVLKCVVGGTIKLSLQDRQAHRDALHGTGTAVSVRTLVAGHWQHYWTGKGRVEKIHKWKQPFWRGHDRQPISNKKYKVEV